MRACLPQCLTSDIQGGATAEMLGKRRSNGCKPLKTKRKRSNGGNAAEKRSNGCKVLKSLAEMQGRSKRSNNPLRGRAVAPPPAHTASRPSGRAGKTGGQRTGKRKWAPRLSGRPGCMGSIVGRRTFSGGAVRLFWRRSSSQTKSAGRPTNRNSQIMRRPSRELRAACCSTRSRRPAAPRTQRR
jgi:hypothetical protein